MVNVFFLPAVGLLQCRQRRIEWILIQELELREQLKGVLLCDPIFVM